jgi:hypothetical protein
MSHLPRRFNPKPCPGNEVLNPLSLERPSCLQLLSSAVRIQFGDLERSLLRPGNVHSADGWDGTPGRSVCAIRARSRASIFGWTQPLPRHRSMSTWRRSGSDMRPGCPKFCIAGSATCSSVGAREDDERFRLGVAAKIQPNLCQHLAGGVGRGGQCLAASRSAMLRYVSPLLAQSVVSLRRIHTSEVGVEADMPRQLIRRVRPEAELSPTQRSARPTLRIPPENL